jgi:hypothetical protein
LDFLVILWVQWLIPLCTASSVGSFTFDVVGDVAGAVGDVATGVGGFALMW